MTISRTQASNGRRTQTWVRYGHRWLGISVVLVVLLLAVSGIALNHSDDWRLDRRYVSWSWLLDAYGIRAPAPGASYADSGHRSTQLGQRLYFDAREVAQDFGTLHGMVVVGPLVLVASDVSALVLTPAGDIVESIDLGSMLPGPIERVGRLDDRAVLQSAGTLYRSDPDITVFDAWPKAAAGDIAWAQASEPRQDEVESIRQSYRGNGLTVERVLADLHSGRIIARAGPLLLDVFAAGLIVLSLTGLYMWFKPWNRRNGAGGARNGQQH